MFLEIVKFYKGGVSIEFIANAPRYFVNSCIDGMNDYVRSENRKDTRKEAQRVINEMKGR